MCSAVSIIAEKKSQFVLHGLYLRVDFNAAARFFLVFPSSDLQSVFGARTIAWARNAASTSGWRPSPSEKFMKSGDDGSVAASMHSRARSLYSC